MTPDSTLPPPAVPAPTETTPPAAVAEGVEQEKSLVERIAFNTIYAGLETRGIKLSLAERVFFEETTRDETKKQNNGQLLGTNLGGDFTSILKVLFSFLQNIFAGTPLTPLNIAGMGDHLANAADGALNQGKQYNVNFISARISERLRDKGGNLAKAADLMTGFTTDGYARYMPGSISEQLAAAQGIPATLPPADYVADAGAGHGLPHSVNQQKNFRDLS